MDINWKNVTKINYIETKDNGLVQCGEGDGSFFQWCCKMNIMTLS